jgi:uncharacterized protein (DUF305 family)
VNVDKIKYGLAVALTATALASCSATTPGTPAAPAAPPSADATPGAGSSGTHNAADATFVQGMIPHHAQAVEMSALVPDRAASPQVKQLATRITAAQGPEIEQMRGFLRGWGMPEAPGGMPGAPGGMDHGSMGHGGTGGAAMPGMMSDQQLGHLRGASGAEFDRLFLTQMISHHEGAIEMSVTELTEGQSAEAKALAQRIIDAQRAEIGEMRGLLTTG